MKQAIDLLFRRLSDYSDLSKGASFRPLILSLLSLLFVCLLGGLVVAEPARASTTIIVSTIIDELSNDGFCSLREAIRAANQDTASGAMAGECPAGSGTDTIVLPSGVYTLTTAGAGDDAALTGDLDISSTLTLRGTNAADTIVDSSGLDRVLEILTDTVAVNIWGVTIKNGYVLAGGGGIFVNSGSQLSLVSSNVISNGAYFGDGLSNNGGTVTLTSSSIISNSVGQSGIYNSGNGAMVLTDTAVIGNRAGIHNSGVMTATNSTISDNTGHDGGGIYNTGLLRLDTSMVSGNTAENGGGIFNNGGMLILSSSIISNNIALAFQSGGGGGILNTSGGTTIMVGGSVSNNRSSSGFGGGGILNWDNSTLLIETSSIEGNMANGAGGGIVNDDGSTLTLVASVAMNNTADIGGGIYNAGILSGTNSSVISNTAIDGGGILNLTGVLTLTASAVISNVASSGAGLINDNDGIASLTNSTVSGNAVNSELVGSHRGGGISSLAGTIHLNNMTIAYNSAVDGGGIYQDGGFITILNTVLADNFSASVSPDCSGTLISQGYNLIQTTTGCIISGTMTGNLVGVNPNPGPLQDNGGPTLTHALLFGSPAIDAGYPAAPGSGGSACEAIDQRGVNRPIDGGGIPLAICDIGAYEFDGPVYRLYLPLNLR